MLRQARIEQFPIVVAMEWLFGYTSGPQSSPGNRRMKQYYVYILSNPARVIYVGMTSDLCRRVADHQRGRGGRFTSKYGVGQLVYFEPAADFRAAVARERYIKGWRRSRKIALIETMNPTWADLLSTWRDLDGKSADPPA